MAKLTQGVKEKILEEAFNEAAGKKLLASWKELPAKAEALLKETLGAEFIEEALLPKWAGYIETANIVFIEYDAVGKHCDSYHPMYKIAGITSSIAVPFNGGFKIPKSKYYGQRLANLGKGKAYEKKYQELAAPYLAEIKNAYAVYNDLQSALKAVRTDIQLREHLPGLAKFLPKNFGEPTGILPKSHFDKINRMFAIGGAV